jgi:hypothetical protein
MRCDEVWDVVWDVTWDITWDVMRDVRMVWKYEGRLMVMTSGLR